MKKTDRTTIRSILFSLDTNDFVHLNGKEYKVRTVAMKTGYREIHLMPVNPKGCDRTVQVHVDDKYNETVLVWAIKSLTFPRTETVRTLDLV